MKTVQREDFLVWDDFGETKLKSRRGSVLHTGNRIIHPVMVELIYATEKALSACVYVQRIAKIL